MSIKIKDIDLTIDYKAIAALAFVFLLDAMSKRGQIKSLNIASKSTKLSIN